MHAKMTLLNRKWSLSCMITLSYARHAVIMSNSRPVWPFIASYEKGEGGGRLDPQRFGP